MPEYLEVLFLRRREVLINGNSMGETNVILELEGGEYAVTLGPPVNFITPPRGRVGWRAAHNQCVAHFKWVFEA